MPAASSRSAKRQQRLRVRRRRHRRLVLDAGLVDLEGRREVEDRLPVLDRDDPPGGERATVPDQVDLVDDRDRWRRPDAGSRRAASARAAPAAPCDRPRPAPGRPPGRRRRAAPSRPGSDRGRCSPRSAPDRGSSSSALSSSATSARLYPRSALEHLVGVLRRASWVRRPVRRRARRGRRVRAARSPRSSCCRRRRTPAPRRRGSAAAASPAAVGRPGRRTAPRLALRRLAPAVTWTPVGCPSRNRDGLRERRPPAARASAQDSAEMAARPGDPDVEQAAAPPRPAPAWSRG